MGDILNEDLTVSIDRLTIGWQGKRHQDRSWILVLATEWMEWHLPRCRNRGRSRFGVWWIWGSKKFFLNWVRFVTVRKTGRRKENNQSNLEVVKEQGLDLQILFLLRINFGLIVLRTFDPVKSSNFNANQAYWLLLPISGVKDKLGINSPVSLNLREVKRKKSGVRMRETRKPKKQVHRSNILSLNCLSPCQW